MADPVVSVFQNYFGAAPRIFRAPGRINLIGEHLDYNEGIVMPGAIDRACTFAIARGQADRCNILAIDLEQGISFFLSDLSPGESWVNYFMGVLDGFLRRGLPVRGVDVVFSSSIPLGAGMSSSAALCSGFAFAVDALFAFGLSRLELARIAQYAEREFAGVQCGLMDQYASLYGEPGALLKLDCRTLTHEVVPWHDDTYGLWLVDTRVKHSLGSSGYNDRRQVCEEALDRMRAHRPDLAALRDVSKSLLAACASGLTQEQWRLASFVVEEMARVEEMEQALQNRDMERAGSLLLESHVGLRDQYQVSCRELDFLVEVARDFSGVAGARMMGGGFGGCTINLLRREVAPQFEEIIREKYFAQFKKEPHFYSVNLVTGVSERPVTN